LGTFIPHLRDRPIQRHSISTGLTPSGFVELGMLDDAALALEDIEPEDKTRTEVLGARLVLYIAAKKWGHGRSGRQSSRKSRTRKRSLVDQLRLFGQTERGRQGAPSECDRA
jgi:hypothetical protein